MVFATHAPNTYATIFCASATFGLSRVPTNRSFHLLVPASSVTRPFAFETWPDCLGYDTGDNSGSSGLSYMPPETMSRQAMRASLFASATATNFGGLRSSIAASQREGFVRPFLICLSSAVAPTINVDRIPCPPSSISAPLQAPASRRPPWLRAQRRPPKAPVVHPGAP